MEWVDLIVNRCQSTGAHGASEYVLQLGSAHQGSWCLLWTSYIWALWCFQSTLLGPWWLHEYESEFHPSVFSFCRRIWTLHFRCGANTSKYSGTLHSDFVPISLEKTGKRSCSADTRYVLCNTIATCCNWWSEARHHLHWSFAAGDGFCCPGSVDICPQCSTHAVDFGCYRNSSCVIYLVYALVAWCRSSTRLCDGGANIFCVCFCEDRCQRLKLEYYPISWQLGLRTAINGVWTATLSAKFEVFRGIASMTWSVQWSSWVVQVIEVLTSVLDLGLLESVSAPVFQRLD